MDYLKDIITEQKKYNRKVANRKHRRYNTEMGKLFGDCEAMIDEILEVHQELKPYWQWWRGEEIPLEQLQVSKEKRERLIDESVDVLKFLMSMFLDLNVDTPEKLYKAYMRKHKVINKRLEDSKKGKDNWLESPTKSLK